MSVFVRVAVLLTHLVAVDAVVLAEGEIEEAVKEEAWR